MSDEALGISVARFTFGIFMDLLIIAVFAAVVSFESDFLGLFLKFALAFIVIRVLFEVRNWLHAVLWYKLFGSKYLAEKVQSWLNKERLPIWNDDQKRSSFMYYLERISTNEYLSINFRLSAISMWTMLSTVEKVQPSLQNKIMYKKLDAVFRGWAQLQPRYNPDH